MKKAVVLQYANYKKLKYISEYQRQFNIIIINNKNLIYGLYDPKTENKLNKYEKEFVSYIKLENECS